MSPHENMNPWCLDSLYSLQTSVIVTILFNTLFTDEISNASSVNSYLSFLGLSSKTVQSPISPPFSTVSLIESSSPCA
jgi:hypothetical protein